MIAPKLETVRDALQWLSGVTGYDVLIQHQNRNATAAEWLADPMIADQLDKPVANVETRLHWRPGMPEKGWTTKIVTGTSGTITPEGKIAYPDLFYFAGPIVP